MAEHAEYHTEDRDCWCLPYEVDRLETSMTWAVRERHTIVEVTPLGGGRLLLHVPRYIPMSERLTPAQIAAQAAGHPAYWTVV